MPVGDEAAELRIPPGVSLLIVLRVCRAAGQDRQHPSPFTLEETRQRADQFELAYDLR